MYRLGLRKQILLYNYKVLYLTYLTLAYATTDLLKVKRYRESDDDVVIKS
jgi:hypothetical protein